MNSERMIGQIQAADPPDSLTPDVLLGAAAIAEFLFGDVGARRKVFHLVETSKLPVFRLGSRICARRSVLLGWIAAQEVRNGH